MVKKYIELDEVMKFLKKHAVVIDGVRSLSGTLRTEIDDLLEDSYMWNEAPCDYKTAADVLRDLNLVGNGRSFSTRIGLSLRKRGCKQYRRRIDNHLGRYYFLPPLKK